MDRYKSSSIDAYYLQARGQHRTCIHPTLHQFHFGQLESQEENLFHTLGSIIQQQLQLPPLQHQSLLCSTVHAVIFHQHVGITPLTFPCQSNAQVGANQNIIKYHEWMMVLSHDLRFRYLCCLRSVRTPASDVSMCNIPNGESSFTMY